MEWRFSPIDLSILSIYLSFFCFLFLHTISLILWALRNAHCTHWISHPFAYFGASQRFFLIDFLNRISKFIPSGFSRLFLSSSSSALIFDKTHLNFITFQADWLSLSEPEFGRSRIVFLIWKSTDLRRCQPANERWKRR